MARRNDPGGSGTKALGGAGRRHHGKGGITGVSAVFLENTGASYSFTANATPDLVINTSADSDTFTGGSVSQTVRGSSGNRWCGQCVAGRCRDPQRHRQARLVALKDATRRLRRWPKAIHDPHHLRCPRSIQAGKRKRRSAKPGNGED
jgi:hypothetical protein